MRNHRTETIFEVLGQCEKSPFTINEMISQGFPVKALVRLSEIIGTTPNTMAAWIGISPTTLARREKDGQLTPNESDRLTRYAKLMDATVWLFEGDETAAKRWLQRKAMALGGETPLSHARTEYGAGEVHVLIHRIEHGVIG